MAQPWLCWSCSGRVKDLPEDPCRCDEYGEQCCKPEEGRQVQVPGAPPKRRRRISHQAKYRKIPLDEPPPSSSSGSAPPTPAEGITTRRETALDQQQSAEDRVFAAPPTPAGDGQARARISFMCSPDAVPTLICSCDADLQLRRTIDFLSGSVTHARLLSRDSQPWQTMAHQGPVDPCFRWGVFNQPAATKKAEKESATSRAKHSNTVVAILTQSS